MNWLRSLFGMSTKERLEVVPKDFTHYEINGSYNIYWKKDESGVWLWEGINHYWQEMKFIDFDKYEKKLIKSNIKGD